MARRLGAALVVSNLVLAGAALAQGDEIATLEREIAREALALSNEPCATACTALRSMQRAADRICALDGGKTHCDAARAKVREARAKVLAACPECAATGGDKEAPAPDQAKTPTRPPPAPSGEKPAQPTTLDDGAPRPAAQPASPPPPAPPPPQLQNAPPRGGCAGCAVEDREEGRGFWLGAASLLVCYAARRRRHVPRAR